MIKFKKVDFFLRCVKINNQGGFMKDKLNYIKREVKYKFKEFKFGTRKMFKEFFNKETNKKQRANMWTFLRLIIPVLTLILSVCALSFASIPLLAATAGLVGFGALTDFLDGKSARKHGSTSEYGKLLDQVSDKVFAGVVGINLLFINPTYIVILLGELLIAAINVGYKVKYNDLDIKSTTIGKIKEWPLFISLGLGFLSPISTNFLTVANVSILISSLFQLLTARSYILNNEKEVVQLRKNEEKIDIENNNTEETKNKELILVKENKGTTNQLEELKKFRNTLVKSDEIEEEKINDNFQKTKTLN